MNKILIMVLFLGCFGLYGCATGNYRNEAVSKESEYFANPQHKMMVTVKAIDSITGLTQMTCNQSAWSLQEQGNSGQSFDTWTPYVKMTDFTDAVNNLRIKFGNNYNKLSDSDKEAVKLQLTSALPNITVTCQSRSNLGIDGKIYFNGKEVASSSANTAYGIVNLRYSFSLEDVLGE